MKTIESKTPPPTGWRLAGQPLNVPDNILKTASEVAAKRFEDEKLAAEEIFPPDFGEATLLLQEISHYNCEIRRGETAAEWATRKARIAALRRHVLKTQRGPAAPILTSEDHTAIAASERQNLPRTRLSLWARSVPGLSEFLAEVAEMKNEIAALKASVAATGKK